MSPFVITFVLTMLPASISWKFQRGSNQNLNPSVSTFENLFTIFLFHQKILQYNFTGCRSIQFVELFLINFIERSFIVIFTTLLNLWKSSVYIVVFIDNLLGSTPVTTESPEEIEKRHKDLMEENVEVGIMFASKAFVQLVANPFVGPLTHKYYTNNNFQTF